jgi:hypothetical protein
MTVSFWGLQGTRFSLTKHLKIRQSVGDGRSAYVKPFCQEGDGLFIVQIEIMLFNFLLNKSLGHEQGSAELIGLDFLVIDSSGCVSVTPEREMPINKEL